MNDGYFVSGSLMYGLPPVLMSLDADELQTCLPLADSHIYLSLLIFASMLL